MVRLVVLLAVLFSLAYSQGWTAQFNQTTTATGIGYNTGSFKFNWATGRFSITWTQPLSETYIYDSAKGYSPVTDGTLSTRTTVSSTCAPPCSVSLVEQPMPPLDVSLTSYHTHAAGTGCVVYTPNQATVVTSFTADPVTGVVCTINFFDGRVFTLGSFAKTTPTISDPPSNCVCDEQLDIFILVDHSSSINDPKMVQFKTFTTSFLNNLHIAPTAINVGMAWFHWTTGLNFAMTGDPTTVNVALSQWWTNCSLPDTISYCDSNPDVPGCVGCQKSGTATATAIQGYKGPTNSRNFPTGQMDVTGAREYFYNSALGGSVRSVPKMFITLTDGAVNSYLDQHDGIDGCTFSECSPDLINAVAALRSTHNSLFPGVSLITVAMGIGAPGTDPNLSLSPEHLAILAENNNANWFQTPDFNSLTSGVLRNLLLRSCPAKVDDQTTNCIGSCCGLCICGACKSPDKCLDNNNCWDATKDSCCNKVNRDPKVACPPANKCTQPTCNTNILVAGSNPPQYGTCSFTATDCSSFVDGCARFNCSLTDGTCTTRDISGCPPVNCVWGGWSIWSTCSVTCGSGTQTSTRSISTPASVGTIPPGTACSGSATQTQSCTGPCCPTPCVYSGWSSWTPNCTNCAGITQTRSRSLTATSTCGGPVCNAALSQTNPCGCANTSCVGANQTLTACDCNAQTKSLVYKVTVTKVGYGANCPYADGTTFTGVPCTAAEISACPVNCIESWSAWTACDCFYFTQNRTHTVTRLPKNGGVACSSTQNYTQFATGCTPTVAQNCPLYGRVCTQNSDCTDQFPCTQDLCLLKPDGVKHCDWSTPTSCPTNLCYSNNTCDNSVVGGCRKQLKTNATACPPPSKCFIPGCIPTGNGGTGSCIQTPVVCPQPLANSTDACQVNLCTNSTGQCTTYDRSKCPPIDCTYDLWSSWSTCSKSCGNGTQTSTRGTTAAKDGGAPCTAPTTQSRPCNPQCCVINCGTTAWSGWSNCATCGVGSRSKTATVNRQLTCAGTNCAAVSPCNATNCTEVLYPGNSIGATCTGTAVNSVCTWTQPCPGCTPRNCTGNNVTGQCFCAANGLSATNIITYVVNQTQITTGNPCPFADGQTWNVSCNAAQISACPKPCIQAWTTWSTCSCYNGTQNRTYTITQAASNGATACAYSKNFSQYQTCTPTSNCSNLGYICNVDADCNDEVACTIDKCKSVLSVDNGIPHCNWDGVPNCTSTNLCLTGFCDRTVGCTTNPITPSLICPPPDACQIPSCDVTRNGGAGGCVYTPVNCSSYTGVNGEACVKLDCNTTTGSCSVPNRTLCPPIPCTYGEWGNWTACPVSCGNSTQSRYRFSNQSSKDGGAACDPLQANQTQNCSVNGGCCPVDCVLSAWTQWSAAQCVNCVPGNQTRNRTVTTPQTCGGTCQALIDTSLTCPACIPVDCVESNTTSPCNCTGNGTYGDWTITHHIDVKPVGPGKACQFPDNKTWFVPCDTSVIAQCPTPCQEAWSNWSLCDCLLLTQYQTYTLLKNSTHGGRPCTYNSTRNLTQTCTPSDAQNCYGPSCKTATDCNDKLACTLDRCVRIQQTNTLHCDWTQNVSCPDNSVCSDVRCDQLKGCVYTQVLFCDDSNNCTIDSCDDVKGCQHKAVKCPDYDICNLGFCNPTSGCGFVKRNCTGNLSIVDNCTVAFCDVNYTKNGLTNPCQAIPICGTRFNLALGIAGGIVALIVVLAVLGGAMVSAAATAGAVVASSHDEQSTTQNPLYSANNLTGVNAAHV